MKTTKKIISMLMAVMMVVTMLPLTAFAATTNNETDAAVVDLKAAITAYEEKMDGTVYTNMSAAYTAYVNANAAIDAYVYGDASIDLATYKNALTTATANMGTVTDPAATATANSRDVDDAISSDYAKMLLYSSKPKDSVYDEGEGNKRNVRFQMYYPANTICLYDGETAPRIPVFAFWYYDQTGFSSRKVYSLFPTDMATTGSPAADSTEFKLQEEWHGNLNIGTGDWTSAWAGGDRCAGYENSKGLTATSTGANRAKWNRLANYMDYVGGGTGFSNGYKKVNLGWYAYTGKNSSDNLYNHYMTGNTDTGNIYLIDYKSHKAAYATRSGELFKVADSKQGGLAALIAAYDAAVEAANNLVNVTPETVVSMSQALVDTQNGIANAVVTTDDSRYDDLRKAINDKKSTYNSTTSDKYTTTSWNAFVAAYDDAKNLMANLTTTGYTNAADAKTKADTLNAVELVVNFTPANAEILENTVDDALVAINNKGVFTSASYSASNLETNVPKAQAEVWGSVESYKDKASLVDSSKQDTVDAWVVTIGEGVASLIVDTDEVVYYGYSMNSAIAYAQTFTASDYSNYETVALAVQNAQKFDTKVISDTSDTSSFRSGIVQAKIDEYVKLTQDIVDAIVALRPSFTNMNDGQVINTAMGDLSITLGSDSGKYYRVGYNYPATTTIFKTTHAVNTVSLNNSTITFYEDNTNQSKCGAGYLDSINVDGTVSGDMGELTSNYDDNDHSLSDPSAYPGKLSMSQTVDGLTYKLSLGKSSSISGSGIYALNKTSFDGYGRDLTGNVVNDASFDFTDSLLNTSGSSAGATGPNGSVAALNGTIKLSASTVADLPGRVATKRPVMTSVSYADKKFSALVRWSYPGAAARVYYGYTTNSAVYTQTLNVIDISGLIDLTNTCATFTRDNYTTTSWNAFLEALKNAKGDMAYADMTPEDVLAECQTRYDNLMSAKGALVEAASNTSIDDALVQAAEIKRAVDNGETRYSTDSYNAFLTARQEAIDAINGTYSDDACLDLTKTDYQSTIDAIAKKVTDAIAALVSMADFTNLIKAASTAIDSYVYSTDDLQALADLLSGLNYLNLSADQKALVEGDKQSEIDAETAKINNAIAALTAAKKADASTLLAAKAKVDAQYNDPDAWDGIADIKAFIDSMTDDENMYSPVTIYGATVYGVNYTQDNVDAAVTTALEGVKPQEYTVTVIDETGNQKTAKYPYGTAVNITSISGKAVDWYYAYTSNTATNTEKYYTTSANIKFVVKGNTTLRTVPKTSTEGNYKVTYVSSLNSNKVLAVDYITASAGKVSSIPEQPSVPYYKSAGYTLNGAEFTTSTPITSDVTVVANYTAISSAPTYTISYANPADDFKVTDYTLSYNEEITFTRDDAKYWIRFNSEEDRTLWLNGNSEGLDHNVYYTVFYGTTYTFRAHEDVYLASLSQEDLDFDLENGFISSQDVLNAPAVRGAENIVYASDKFSMISTYTLPDEYTLVETGVLFSKDATRSGLTFNDVDSRTVYRLKSSQHTKGNQYVVSIVSTKIATGTQMVYMPYLIYADSNGKQHVVYADSDIQITYSPNVAY